jgi:hypothetical protein
MNTKELAVQQHINRLDGSDSENLTGQCSVCTNDFRKINRTRKLSSENTDAQLVSKFADLAGIYELKVNSIALMLKGMLMPIDDQPEIVVRYAGAKVQINGKLFV